MRPHYHPMPTITPQGIPSVPCIYGGPFCTFCTTNDASRNILLYRGLCYRYFFAKRGPHRRPAKPVQFWKSTPAAGLCQHRLLALLRTGL